SSSTTGKREIATTVHTAESESQLDYCTVGRCRPRPAQPWRDALAFGGLALAAASMTRGSRGGKRASHLLPDTLRRSVHQTRRKDD
ncbi:hypothetical protein MK280_07590, partial [Myxococcota bacterium]|nr:hypothetical protein [Myxococcota bacterium]